MLSPRFFVAAPIARNVPANYTLDDAAAQHVRVLRLGEDDPLVLFDGGGGEFSAEVATLGKREVSVRLRAFHAIEREALYETTLVQALATGDKMDWIIQKATELGVSAIQPVMSSRATLNLSADRAAKRAVHWRAVAIAACEQCGRNRVPLMHPVMDFKAWLARPATAPRALLDPLATAPLTPMLKNQSALDLIVGPEGGFSDEEIGFAERHHVVCVKFGERVLRTETAGPAALAARLALIGE